MDEAKASYHRALELRSEDTDCLYNLAGCLKDNEEPEQAIHYYQKVLALEPEHVEALGNLAYLYHRSGQSVLAKECYQSVVEHRPDHAGARHMLAALGGEVTQSPPTDYVRDLFDQFSDSFDESLQEKLDYRVPALLRELFCEQSGDLEIERCLDLGCGTGLGGEAFRPFCRELVGMDLSAKMVEQARHKGIYESLHVAELLEFLRAGEDAFDLLLAADVLAYLGDLEPVMSASATRATERGLFCFSTEHSTQDGWQLQSTGRFAHNPDYVLRVAQQNGWRPMAVKKERLRKEGKGWIEGDLFLLGREDQPLNP
jgi:predicted TPR repeat methyltransferase